MSPKKGQAIPTAASRIIIPLIPGNPTHKKELEEDLEKMGCLGLLERPWNL